MASIKVGVSQLRRTSAKGGVILSLNTKMTHFLGRWRELPDGKMEGVLFGFSEWMELHTASDEEVLARRHVYEWSMR